MDQAGEQKQSVDGEVQLLVLSQIEKIPDETPRPKTPPAPKAIQN